MQDAFDVAGQVADGDVDLREGEPDGAEAVAVAVAVCAALMILSVLCAYTALPLPRYPSDALRPAKRRRC
ncbi:MAG TPA: hypothetical protein VKT52_01830 [Ktedonobacterales bacterium]|nr:hypothetical protein [Ktedonobacterales bacterium]